ncbi:MAG: hypothetical protein JXB50_05370 [Spirochaetes bacterium]|nr:hypothetical protein [Spirochaetota bacterium]
MIKLKLKISLTIGCFIIFILFAIASATMNNEIRPTSINEFNKEIKVDDKNKSYVYGSFLMKQQGSQSITMLYHPDVSVALWIKPKSMEAESFKYGRFGSKNKNNILKIYKPVFEFKPGIGSDIRLYLHRPKYSNFADRSNAQIQNENDLINNTMNPYIFCELPPGQYEIFQITGSYYYKDSSYSSADSAFGWIFKYPASNYIKVLDFTLKSNQILYLGDFNVDIKVDFDLNYTGKNKVFMNLTVVDSFEKSKTDLSNFLDGSKYEITSIFE